MRSCPLKHLLDLNDSGTWGEDPTGSNDVVVLRSTDIDLDGSWRIHDPAIRHVSGVDILKTRLERGDIVVVKSSGSPEHLGKSAIVTEAVAKMNPCFANFVQRLRPSSSTDSRYIWYVLNSKSAADVMASLGNTTTGLRNLNGEIIGSVVIPVTELPKQRAIADYLDKETGCIDALITKQHRIIDLLTERRQALITTVVSGDMTIPEMDSTLKSLGPYSAPSPRRSPQGAAGALRRGCRMTPRLKHVAKLHVDSFPSNCERPYVALEHVESWTGSLVKGLDLAMRSSSTGMASVEPGDVLFGKLRPYLAKTWLVDRPAFASTELMCMRPEREIDSRWLAYLTMTSSFVGWAVATSEGTKMPRTNWEKLSQYRTWVPSVVQQRAIADYLDNETGYVNALIAKTHRIIDLLAERRQALITAAVTGQLAIPGVAA